MQGVVAIEAAGTLAGWETTQKDVQRNAKAVDVALRIVTRTILHLGGGVEVGSDGTVGSAAGTEDALGGDGRFTTGCTGGGGRGGVIGIGIVLVVVVMRTMKISGQTKVRKANLEVSGTIVGASTDLLVVHLVVIGGRNGHEEDILGLDVAMDDAPLMQSGQGL